MKITVHRGTNQIGGCVTEIATRKSRILIDLGSSLPGSNLPDLTAEEIKVLCNGIDAIFYTHYHGDHIGHLDDVPGNVEQYIGEMAKEVMLCKYETLNKSQDHQKTIDSIGKMKCYHTARPVFIRGGDIKITPYFVSHSAADAYMFKIEADGKTVLHTGDFRKHGYLGKGLMLTLETYVKQVDLLIIEGTMLGRTSEVVDHEIAIQTGAVNLLKRSSRNCLFALCSSTDIDRLASFHAACKKTGAAFVCDNYQKKVLNIFTKYSGVKSLFYDFGDTIEIGNKCNFDRDLRPKGFIMPIRPGMIGLVQKMRYYFPDAELIYSLWKGYYQGTDKQINPRVVELVALFEGATHYLHTSGHADVETLQEVCRIVRPRTGIIPIHKEKTSHYEDLPIAGEYRIISSSTETDHIMIEIK